MSRIPLTNTVSEPDKQPIKDIKTPASTVSDNIEVPYTDYSSSHNHPYLVDYFQLGSTWEDPVGGFPKEVNLIESYITGKIKNGEMANSIKAVKNVIRDMEKFNNLTKEERAVVKLEVLSNYVEFLEKNSKLKINLRRYGNI